MGRHHPLMYEGFLILSLRKNFNYDHIRRSDDRSIEELNEFFRETNPIAASSAYFECKRPVVLSVFFILGLLIALFSCYHLNIVQTSPQWSTYAIFGQSWSSMDNVLYPSLGILPYHVYYPTLLELSYSFDDIVCTNKSSDVIITSLSFKLMPSLATLSFFTALKVWLY